MDMVNLNVQYDALWTMNILYSVQELSQLKNIE